MLWLFLAILALLAYAIWGVMNGVVAKNMDPHTGLFFSSVGYITVGFIALCMLKFKVNYTPLNLVSGIGLGLATGVGGLFFLLAVKFGGNVNVIVVLTSLYPIVTLFLNLVLFNKTLSITQVIGSVLAVIAVVLVSIG